MYLKGIVNLCIIVVIICLIGIIPNSDNGSLEFKLRGLTKFDLALMYAENNVRLGYDEGNQVWYPHRSLGGGTGTIAYGHKLTEEESFGNYVIIDNDRVPLAGGITIGQALDLYQQDVEIARKGASENFPLFLELPRAYQDILTNLVFNAGKGAVTVAKWPNLYKAMLSCDNEEVKRQMVTTYLDARTGRRVHLTERRDTIADGVDLDSVSCNH